uniref:BolA-like protein n=1 Tax=Panagrolaimus sp. PS1159 TaxID=55785 RepID=A0AC35GQK2_9BILA
MLITRCLRNMTSRTETIKSLLSEKFKPIMLEVKCESDQHNVPKGSEMHFYVGVISEEFNGLSTLQRHRQISKLVYEQVPGVHALRIHAKSPTEVSDLSDAPEAPKCLGGSRR